MKNSNVAIAPNINEALTEFCIKTKLTKKDFIEISLKYFNDYSINPAKHEKPTVEIEKMHKRIEDLFKFSRAQERDILKPFFITLLESVQSSNLKDEEYFVSLRNGLLNRKSEIADLKNELLKRAQENSQLKNELNATRKEIAELKQVLYTKLKIIVDNQHVGITGKKQTFD